MKHQTLFIVWILTIISLTTQANNLSIIPYPNSVVTHPGSYMFERCNLSFDKGLKNEATHLESMLKDDFGISSTPLKKGGDIRLLLSSQFKNAEAYRLQINQEGVTITASSPQGVFYGIQTLRQVLQMQGDRLCADYLTIDDEPAFRWRAFMLDDARAFKGMAVVKQLLDEMAVLKMNTFHWHLTEDQGWRIEIKKYPKLTEIGGTRDSTQLNWYESTTFDGTPLTGYYTQKEIREVVRYAADRHITIIPEIEMPGHASAAIAAYPWLGTSGKTIEVPCAFGVLSEAFNVADPKVLGFLEDVLDEVIDLFPSKIIHIGGDEVKYEQWKNSPVVQQFMKEKQIGSPTELQVWFTNHICTYLQSKGKRMMGWNDVTGDKLHHYHDLVEGNMQQKLSSDALVQFWTGDLDLLQKAAESGHEIVNSLHEYTYLNYNHDRITPGLEYTFAPIPLEKAYSFTPIPKDFPAKWRKQIIGMGCQMWGEWIPSVKSMYKMVYPYWAAHAETGWTQESRKDYVRFRNALPYFVTRWVGKGYISVSDKWMQQQHKIENKLGPRMEKEELTTSYVTPERIVWTSDSTGSSIKYCEKLLLPSSGQTYVNADNCCVLDSHKDAQPGILLDFGRELHGGLQISTAIRKDTKPLKIRLRFGESVSEAMSSVGKEGVGLLSATNDHAMRDMIVELPWLGNLEVGNTGFRFVRIDLVDTNETLPLNSVRAVFKYRDIPYLGSFVSDDKRLNKIWETGAYTVHLNMQDYLWDGIKRDRLVWIGDLHPEVMAVNTVFGNQPVVYKSLDFVRDNTALPGWMNKISSYSLWWMIIQRDLYLYQGNKSYLNEQKEYLSALLKQIEANVGVNGKEQYPGANRFLDWPTSGNVQAIHVGLQSLTVLAVEAASQIAQWLEDANMEAYSAQLLDKLAKYAPEIPSNKQAASLSALSGLTDVNDMSKIVLENGANDFSTFYGYYMLQCLAKASCYEDALNLISDYWGGMLDLGATTFWEDLKYSDLQKASRIDEVVPAGSYDIHADGGAYCYKGLRHSLCHGWASGPTSWLSQYVLGITPVAPGCSTVRIQPHLGHLKWVKGTFPTPYGLIEVEHHQSTDGSVESIVKVPEGVTCLKD